jgi:hypothetical protein
MREIIFEGLEWYLASAENPDTSRKEKGRRKGEKR